MRSLLQCCKTKNPEKQVKQIVTKFATLADVLVALERQYPSYETDLSIRAGDPEPSSVAQKTPSLPGFPSCLPTWTTG